MESPPHLRTACLIILCAITFGFFYYHFLAAVGFIPMFLGGWASWWNLIGSVVLGMYVIAVTTDYRVHLPFLALIGVAAGYTIFFRLFGEEWARDEIFVENGKLILGWTCLYFLGFSLRLDQRLISVLTGMLVAMSVPTLMLMDVSSKTFMVVEQYQNPNVSDYPGFATAYSMVAIMLLSLLHDWRKQAATIAISTVVLYVLSSRSELLGFTIVIAIWSAFMLWRRRLIPVTLNAAAIAGAFALLFAGSSAVLLVQRMLPTFVVSAATPKPSLSAEAPKPALSAEAPKPAPSAEAPKPAPSAEAPKSAPSAEPAKSSPLAERAEPPPPTPPRPAWMRQADRPIAGIHPTNRNLELSHIKESESFRQRWELLASGFEGIWRSPILGDYGGQVRDRGAVGFYIHNMFSAWQAFGLLGFLLYAGLSAWAPLRAGYHQIYDDDPMWRMTLHIGIYCAVLILLTRAIYWPMPALGWGLVAARMDSMKVRRPRTASRSGWDRLWKKT